MNSSNFLKAAPLSISSSAIRTPFSIDSALSKYNEMKQAFTCAYSNIYSQSLGSMDSNKSNEVNGVSTTISTLQYQIRYSNAETVKIKVLKRLLNCIFFEKSAGI